MEEEVLVRAAQKGDDEAFFTLIANNKAKLYSTAYCYLKNEHDALEAIQETTCRAYIGLKKLKEPKYFCTWIIRIMINYCIDEQKRRRKFTIEELGPGEEVYDDTERIYLEEAIEKLHRNYRMVLDLKYFQDMTNSDIARVMNRPEGTIKTWIFRALKLLRNSLGREGDYNV